MGQGRVQDTGWGDSRLPGRVLWVRELASPMGRGFS